MLSPCVNMAINNEFSDNAVSRIYFSLLLSYYFIIIYHLCALHSQLYTSSKYVSNVYIVATIMWLQFVLHVMLFPLPSALYT
jgi:hypothetical protein